LSRVDCPWGTAPTGTGMVKKVCGARGEARYEELKWWFNGPTHIEVGRALAASVCGTSVT
jgi:hypothetical protein